MFRRVFQEKPDRLDLYNAVNLSSYRFPKYIIFYNGLQEEPDRTELRLSDAFRKDDGMEPCLELKVVMININLGHNRELMERCRKLQEYARFVAEGRAEGKTMGVALSVLELLADIGEIPEELRTAVMSQTDMGILTKWLKLASKVETVEAFLEQNNRS